MAAIGIQIKPTPARCTACPERAKRAETAENCRHNQPSESALASVKLIFQIRPRKFSPRHSTTSAVGRLFCYSFLRGERKEAASSRSKGLLLATGLVLCSID